MKTKNNTTQMEKNLDLLISKINSNDILGVSEMIYVRGGDGNDTIPPPPPPFPKY